MAGAMAIPGRQRLLLDARRRAFFVRVGRRLVGGLGLAARFRAMVEARFVILLAMHLGGSVMRFRRRFVKFCGLDVWSLGNIHFLSELSKSVAPKIILIPSSVEGRLGKYSWRFHAW
jgi:hypothetical protein